MKARNISLFVTVALLLVPGFAVSQTKKDLPLVVPELENAAKQAARKAMKGYWRELPQVKAFQSPVKPVESLRIKQLSALDFKKGFLNRDQMLVIATVYDSNSLQKMFAKELLEIGKEKVSFYGGFVATPEALQQEMGSYPLPGYATTAEQATEEVLYKSTQHQEGYGFVKVTQSVSGGEPRQTILVPQLEWNAQGGIANVTWMRYDGGKPGISQSSVSGVAQGKPNPSASAYEEGVQQRLVAQPVMLDGDPNAPLEPKQPAQKRVGEYDPYKGLFIPRGSNDVNMPSSPVILDPENSKVSGIGKDGYPESFLDVSVPDIEVPQPQRPTQVVLDPDPNAPLPKPSKKKRGNRYDWLEGDPKGPVSVLPHMPPSDEN